MSGEPTVSIIIPFYNTPCNFMQEAIESIFAQTYNSWELLLVDDGSTNESTQLARGYAEQHPENVRYFDHPCHENLGVSASRKLGISRSKGGYIAFLDADDMWLPENLEQQVGLLEAHPEAALGYGNSQYWYSWTGNIADHDRDFVPKLGLRPGTVVQPPTLLPLFLTGAAAVPCPSNVLVRREAFEVIGSFEDSFRTMYEDQVFYAKICLRAPVAVGGTCLHRYRQHPGSLCSVAESSGQERAARLAFLNWLECYLQAQQIKDPKVWKALREALRRHETSTARDVSNLAHSFRRRMRKLLLRMRTY